MNIHTHMLTDYSAVPFIASLVGCMGSIRFAFSSGGGERSKEKVRDGKPREKLI